MKSEFLALLLVMSLATSLGLSATPVHANEEPAATAATHPAEEAAHGGTAHGDAGAADAGEGHGAAGEEQHGSGEPLVARIVNFLIFFGFLAYVGLKPLAAFLRKRKQDIEDAMSAAEKARAEAERKMAEIDARLATLPGEIEAIRASARQQADEQARQIVVAAEEEAARILQQAEVQVAGLEGAAVRRLRATAADLAVEAARDIVLKQMKPEDRQRLFDRYVKSLQKAAS